MLGRKSVKGRRRRRKRRKKKDGRRHAFGGKRRVGNLDNFLK